MTAPPAPGATGPEPTWDPIPPAEAGPLSQGLVLVTAALALWLATALAESPHVGVVGAGVLAASVVVGLVTGAHRAFRAIPGLVAALLSVMALSFSTAFLGANVPRAWGWAFLVVPLALIGLDWQRVGRLHAVVAVATFVVIPLAAAHRSGAMATALGWLVLAAASMWSLEQDRRRGEDRPLPLVPGAVDAEPHADDLLRTVLLAVAVGVVAALLVTVPSCDLPLNLPGTGGGRSVQVQPGDPGTEGQPGYDGQPGSGGQPGPGDGQGGDSDQGGGSADRSPGDDQPPKRPKPPRLSAWWLLLVVALAAAVAWFWWRRGRTAPLGQPDREWALALVAQIDEAGRARGHPRTDASTVLAHTDDLAASVLPDDRLRQVGRVLNDALFGHAPVTAATRLWAESVVDEILEAHPVERRPRR